ncbi:MAG TPA: hypothetical protein VKA86_09960 [Candidatus Krumholzibacteria bacterium]|nr:hypothetical protein [Candidatus Krumholzibacteria bacterium]
MTRDRIGPHPRSVRAPERLLAEWTDWCRRHRGSPEPDAAFRSQWIWWDSPDGRLHRENTQLVERRSSGQPSRIELHRGLSRRTLDEDTVATWLARGRTIVPLLWTSSYRRIWLTPGGGQFEWQEWTLVGGGPARMVAVVEPGPELMQWWTAARADGTLGRRTAPPTWSDHAVAAVNGWLGDRAGTEVFELISGLALGRALAADDSPLAPVLLDRVHRDLEQRLAAPSGAVAPGHPAWRAGLRAALDARIRSRPGLLAALARSLAHGPLDASVPATHSDEAAHRSRTLHTALRAMRPHLDVPTRKLRRRIAALAAAQEHRARLVCTDRWLARLGASDDHPLDADARMEAGARRRRLVPRIEESDQHVRLAAAAVPRRRLRRLVRSLPDPAAGPRLDAVLTAEGEA